MKVWEGKGVNITNLLIFLNQLKNYNYAFENFSTFVRHTCVKFKDWLPR